MLEMGSGKTVGHEAGKIPAHTKLTFHGGRVLMMIKINKCDT